MAICIESIGTVGISYMDHDWRKQEEAQLQEWADRFRDENDGELVGEIIQFPVADNYARYMVEKEEPLTLVHVATGDAYDVHPAMIKGLDLNDVREEVLRLKAIREIFKRRA